MTLEPRDLQERNCNDCDFWRSRINRKKGVVIPGGYGKCIRPEGHCAPDVVRGGIGMTTEQKRKQIRTITQQLAQENEQMAKRNNPLFKRTVSEPELTDQAPAELEQPTGGGCAPDEYHGLDEAPPEYFSVKPLSSNERKRRVELEGIISQNMKGFLMVSYALREIQQRQLYRTTHQTFSDYCKEMWEMARSRAYQLIDAADLVDMMKNVHNCGQNQSAHHGEQIEWIPANECQARALLKFKDNPEDLRKVVSEAVQTAPDGKITASHIKKTARRLNLEKVREVVTKARQRTNQSPKIAEDFRKAFNAFLDQVNIARAEEYKHTDQEEAIKHVRMILVALEADL